MADSPWTGSDDGQESPFPFVLLHHLILAQGTPVRLTCHHQWMHKFAIITVTVTKALIEEELEEEARLLIQLLADKTPTLLLNVTLPPPFTCLADRHFLPRRRFRFIRPDCGSIR